MHHLSKPSFCCSIIFVFIPSVPALSSSAVCWDQELEGLGKFGRYLQLNAHRRLIGSFEHSPYLVDLDLVLPHFDFSCRIQSQFDFDSVELFVIDTSSISDTNYSYPIIAGVLEVADRPMGFAAAVARLIFLLPLMIVRTVPLWWLSYSSATLIHSGCHTDRTLVLLLKFSAEQLS